LLNEHSKSPFTVVGQCSKVVKRLFEQLKLPVIFPNLIGIFVSFLLVILTLPITSTKPSLFNEYLAFSLLNFSHHSIGSIVFSIFLASNI
jgi:hypothetical protein